MNHKVFFSQEELSRLIEQEARLEQNRLAMEAREKYRKTITIRRILFVVSIGTLVFILPGLVLALIGTKLDILQLLAIDVIASLFCHPIQLLIVDWACNYKRFIS